MIARMANTLAQLVHDHPWGALYWLSLFDVLLWSFLIWHMSQPLRLRWQHARAHRRLVRSCRRILSR